MPNFEELKQRYMYTASTAGGSSSPLAAIPIFPSCQVQTLLDAPPYFNDLKSEINRLTGAGSFAYICGWWCGHDFSLDGATAAAALADLLIAKSRAGVDVRVLGWVMAPEVMQDPRVRNAGAGGMLGLNGDTMAFVQRLRTETTLASKGVLNILSHPAGAAHLKMAIVGSATQAVGFTGGLDLEKGRFTRWRDVQTRVTGPATQVFFDAFRAMWSEVKGRPSVTLSAPNDQAPGSSTVTIASHSAAMPDLPARTVASTATTRMHVQPVRTLPKYNFATGGSLGSLPRNQPLSFTPNGLFEVKTIWKKAIRAAQSYIYIEDQGFTSFEVFDWINAAVKASPELKVVLLTGQSDPNDQPNLIPSKLFAKAVNDHLLAGLSAAEQAGIGVFRHLTLTVHSKTSIVDDNWAIVGSANSMRRSLYTDFEHSVAFMDEDDVAVRAYRASLWGQYFNRSMSNPNDGLREWFAIPFRTTGGTPHPSGIERMRIPFPAVTITADEQVMADEVIDCDSRDVWGDDLIQLHLRRAGAGSMGG
jgi:phosphatidylserine/phosphatidylglycerophosphate/cardiolipin synthase-like enzyme